MPYRNKIVQNLSTQESRGGRPRDAEREAQILATVLDVLSQQGFDALTFEEVARRAKASKATLYRRWASKRDMVVAAVKAGPAAEASSKPKPVDTGSLRGDLLSLCERLNATLKASEGSMSLLLLKAGLEDPELCEYLEDATGPTGARLPEPVLAAAISRGELPEGSRAFPYEEVTGSVLLLRRLNGLPTDTDYLGYLIDTILIPSLAASSFTTKLPPRALFSGATPPLTKDQP